MLDNSWSKLELCVIRHLRGFKGFELVLLWFMKPNFIPNFIDKGTFSKHFGFEI